MMTVNAHLTNRDKLMAELSELSNDALYLAFADNHITRALDDAQCDYCKETYERCPSQSCEDVPCHISLSEWLDMPAQPARILRAT